MRALVTGATGFVGSVLCRQLLGKGVFVRACTRGAGSEMSASEVVGVSAIDGDTEWTDALRDIDVVFHLAAIAHIVGRANRTSVPYETVNAVGTERLAQESARAGVTYFGLLSSLKVNGEASPPGGFRESDRPRPVGPYALSKAHAEERLAAVAALTGLPYSIVRPPLVYGPGVRANFLALVHAIDRGHPLPLGAVHNRRSLIYVENLCSGLRCVASHRAAAGQIFLVSDGEPVSTAELVRRLAAACGRSPRLFTVPPGLLRAAATLVGKRDTVDKLIESLVVDDQKIRSLLGWRPEYTLENGLAATAAWYRRVHDR